MKDATNHDLAEREQIMVQNKYVTAAMTKNGPAFYKGQEIHPSVIDEGSDLLAEAMQDKDNLVNRHGIKVIPVRQSVDGAMPHFRISDENYQAKAQAFGETLHNRFRDTTHDMLEHSGSDAFRSIVSFDGAHNFRYGSAACEKEVDGYRPDVAVFHASDEVKGIVALEVVHSSPPSKEKVQAYMELGHVVLRLNIKTIAEAWLKSGAEVSDDDIKQFILQERYKVPRSVNRALLRQVNFVWLDLIERERERVRQIEIEARDRQAQLRAKREAQEDARAKIERDKQRAELRWRHQQHEAELAEKKRKAQAKIAAEHKARKERCLPCEHRYPCAYFLSSACGPNYTRSVASNYVSDARK